MLCKSRINTKRRVIVFRMRCVFRRWKRKWSQLIPVQIPGMKQDTPCILRLITRQRNSLRTHILCVAVTTAVDFVRIYLDRVAYSEFVNKLQMNPYL
jgi:hypothetical protein